MYLISLRTQLKWNNYRKLIWKDFVETTTLHGPNHISSTKRFWRKYYIIVVSIMVVMFMGHASFLIFQYLKYPMNTDIKFQNILYSYPDITICPNSGSSKYLMNKSREAQYFYNLTETFWQNKKIYRQAWTKTTKRSFLKYYYKFSDKIGRMPHHHILWCQINGQSCLDKIFITEHPTYYRCFTLQPDTKSILPGPTHGITILLHKGDPTPPLLQLNEDFTFEEQSSFNRSTVDIDSGFIIGFHDHKTFPNFPLTALPAYVVTKFGEKFRISLDLTAFKAANMIKRPCDLTKNMKPIDFVKIDNLSRNFPKSRKGIIDDEKLSFDYLRQSCIATYRQKLLFEKCGCFSEEYNIPFKLKRYGYLWCFDVEGKTDKIIKIDSTIQCMKNINMFTENEVLYQYLNKTKKKYLFLKAFQICPLRCDRLIHLIHSVYKDHVVNSISLTHFQNYFEYIRLNGLTNDFIQPNQIINPKDVITLDISAISEYINEIEEYPAFDLLNLVSQIGCISGLYVGITMFTLFELFELAAQVLFNGIVPALQKRFLEKKSKYFSFK